MALEKLATSNGEEMEASTGKTPFIAALYPGSLIMVMITSVISIYIGAKKTCSHKAFHHLSEESFIPGKTQPRYAIGDKTINMTRIINLVNNKRATTKKRKVSISINIDAKRDSMTILPVSSFLLPVSSF